MNESTYSETYIGFRIPLVAGGYAWFDISNDDVCLTTIEHIYPVMSLKKIKDYIQYLEEIKSGEGNWIIHPKADNYWITWKEIIHKQAEVVYITRIVNESWSSYRSTP